MTRIPRPSPATLIAFVALFVALGGPSQAAQLARKVTHHHTNRGPRGPRGLTGRTGPTGPAGPRGNFAAPVIRTANIPARTDVSSAIASCNPGEIATGGGVGAGVGVVTVTGPQPDGHSWVGSVNRDPSNPATPVAGTVYVVCVGTS